MSGTPLTGSAIERALACAPSILLPATRIILEAGLRGTAIHEFLASVPVLGREEALAQVLPEYLDACEAIDLSALPASQPDDWAQEVAFAYDPETDTARELHRGLGSRDYNGCLPHEIPGTVDVLGVTFDAVIVPDYKTGRLARRTRAARSAQLRFYALAAARALKKERAVIALIHIPEDGQPWWDVAELTSSDLDDAAMEIRDLLGRIDEEAAHMNTGGVPNVVEGDHCTYCPAYGRCAAKIDLAIALGTGAVSTPVLTAESAPLILERLENAESLLERIRKSVEQFAELTPFTAGPGEVFGLSDKSTEKIDADTAMPILEARFGDDAELALKVEASITKERLKDVVRAWAKRTPGAKLGPVEKATLEELRAKGAVKVSVSRKVRRHKGDLPALPEPAAPSPPPLPDPVVVPVAPDDLSARPF